MDRFLEELPILIITVVVLILLGVLLVTKTILPTDSIVNLVLTIVLPFWFLQSAFKWQSGSTSTAPPPLQTQPAQPQNNLVAPVSTDTRA